MTADFLKNVVAAAAETGADHTKTVAGGGGEGGDYTPPAEGRARARFVGYVETGKHTRSFKGQPKTKQELRLFFELSGPKHPPREVDGKKYPHIIEVEESLSLHEKANWPKLFAKLNYSGKAKHPVELLGSAYLVTVTHRKWAKAGEDKSDPTKWTGVDPKLRGNDGSYNIDPPSFEDPETGETRAVKVDPAITPLRAFLWNNPSKEQWDSIFIEGEWPERKDKDGKVTKKAASKNVLQLRCRAADNFGGSPLDEMLKANGISLDLPSLSDPDMDADYDEQSAPPAAAAKDPLAGAAKATGFDDLDDDIPF